MRSSRGGRSTPTAEWDRARGLLAEAGFGYLADRPFGFLSDGERQQVLLARALISRPELLLLDEPAAGLDVGGRERLVAYLARLAADPDHPATVMVTHHVEEIPPGFTHALLLRQGRVVAAGSLPEVITPEAMSEAFGLALQVGYAEGRWSCRAFVPSVGTPTPRRAVNPPAHPEPGHPPMPARHPAAGIPQARC